MLVSLRWLGKVCIKQVVEQMADPCSLATQNLVIKVPVATPFPDATRLSRINKPTQQKQHRGHKRAPSYTRLQGNHRICGLNSPIPV
jgi:hypothetical protein